VKSCAGLRAVSCVIPSEWSFAMAEIDKPSEKEFVQGAFSAPSAPDNHVLAKGILAAALWRLFRK